MRYLLPDPAYNQVSDPESSNSSSYAAPEHGPVYNDSLTSATNLNLSLILNLRLNQTATTSPPPSYYDYVYEYDYDEYEDATSTATTTAVPMPNSVATEPLIPDYEPRPQISEVMGPYFWVKMAIPKAADKDQLGMFWDSLQDMYKNAFTRQGAPPPTATELGTPTPKVIEWMSFIFQRNKFR